MTAQDIATDKRKHGWFPIDNAVIENFTLTPHEGWLYVVIVKYANRQTGECFPSHSTLAKTASMSKRSVIRCLSTLEEKGLIRIEKDTKPNSKEKANNHYFLLDISEQETKRDSCIAGDGSDRESPPSDSQTPGVVTESHNNKNQENKNQEQEEKEPSADTPNGDQQVEDPEPVKDVQPHIAIIDAYWAGLPGGKPIGADYPRHVALAAKVRDAGYAAHHIKSAMATIYDNQEYKFWHAKVIPFEEAVKILKVLIPDPAEQPDYSQGDPFFDPAFLNLSPVQAQELRLQRTLDALNKALGKTG